MSRRKPIVGVNAPKQDKPRDLVVAYDGNLDQIREHPLIVRIPDGPNKEVMLDRINELERRGQSWSINRNGKLVTKGNAYVNPLKKSHNAQVRASRPFKAAFTRFEGQTEYTEYGKLRCIAAKTDGTRCGSGACDGYQNCRRHGGWTPVKNQIQGGNYARNGPTPETNQNLGNRYGTDNLNGYKHGLYSKVLRMDDLEVYKEALRSTPQDVARHTAALLAARVHGALSSDMTVDPVLAAVLPVLAEKVKDGYLTKEQVREFIAKHNAPSLVDIAKSTAPMATMLKITQGEGTENGMAEVMAIANKRNQESGGSNPMKWKD